MTWTGISSLDLPHQVAQMVIVRASGQLLDPDQITESLRLPGPKGYSCINLQPLIQTTGIGGIWLQAGTAIEALLNIQRFQAWATVPLLVGAEVEAGVGACFAGATAFPNPFCLYWLGSDASTKAQALGEVTAREAAALGLNWLLAPVTDLVLSRDHPDLALISIQRTLGRDPDHVGHLVQTWIRATQPHPVLTTAKYFPGYCGLLRPDSVTALPSLDSKLGDWLAKRWIPLQQAIAAGVDAIMTSHVKVAEIDPEWPVTLSTQLIEPILRKKWSYSGLVVSDALDQPWLTQHYDPGDIAVRAVMAGVDLLLAPVDPEAAIQAICQAVEQGSIPPERIAHSVTRILSAKARLFSEFRSQLEHYWPPLQHPQDITSETESPLVEKSSSDKATWAQVIEGVQSTLGQADAKTCARTLTRSAIRGSHLMALPLTPHPGWINWIWIDQSLGSLVLTADAPALTVPQAKGLQTLISDHATPLVALEQVLAKATGLLVQWFVSPPYYPEFEGVPPLIHHLCQEHLPKIKTWICYGAAEPFPTLRLLTSKPADPIPYIQSLDSGRTAQYEVMQKIWVPPSKS